MAMHVAIHAAIHAAMHEMHVNIAQCCSCEIAQYLLKAADHMTAVVVNAPVGDHL